MRIDRFIRVGVSTSKSLRERRIEALFNALSDGDTVIVTELSRLGRNMFQTLDLINKMSEMGMKPVFVRQPALSTTGSHAKLLLAFYSYFAKAERDFIAMRTKQGMASAKAQGKHVGRPKGSRDKNRALDPYFGGRFSGGDGRLGRPSPAVARPGADPQKTIGQRAAHEPRGWQECRPGPPCGPGYGWGAFPAGFLPSCPTPLTPLPIRR